MTYEATVLTTAGDVAQFRAGAVVLLQGQSALDVPVNFSVATSKFTVNASTGAAVFAGTISATGGGKSLWIAPTDGSLGGWIELGNTGGVSYLAIDNSTGSLFGNGNYALTIASANKIAFATNGSLTAKMTLNADGSLTAGAISGTTGTFQTNQNAGTTTATKNTTSGTGAFAAYNLTANGVAASNLYQFSSGYTSSGIYTAEHTLMEAYSHFDIATGGVLRGSFSSTGLSVTGTLSNSSYAVVNNATATPAGGATAAGLYFGSSLVGITWGSGAPTVNAARGSLYIRTDNGANTSLYINRDGGTTWAAVTSA